MVEAQDDKNDSKRDSKQWSLKVTRDQSSLFMRLA